MNGSALFTKTALDALMCCGPRHADVLMDRWSPQRLALTPTLSGNYLGWPLLTPCSSPSFFLELRHVLAAAQGYLQQF